ncbi:hypothetical protein Pelo_15223 [Pelomyxa schiedti]|nr:hypothetical protein Pelo_15223 [Pelomyxa schiedti]
MAASTNASVAAAVATGTTLPNLCCPFCLGVFQHPVSLQCGDSICRKCLVSCVANQCALSLPLASNTVGATSTSASRTPTATATGSVDGASVHTTLLSYDPVRGTVGVKCPKCSAVTTVTVSQCMKELEPNTQLAELLQQREQARTGSVACIDCDQKATAHCSACGSLCDRCWEEAHKRRSAASHVKLPLEQAAPEVPSNCPKHPKKEIKLYCVNCTDLLCSVCAVSFHQGHKLIEMSEQTGLSKPELPMISKRCLEQKTKVDVAVQQLNQAISSVEQKHAKLQADVDKFGAELEALLRNRIDFLKTCSATICSRTVEALNRQKSIFSAISETLEGSSSSSLSAMQSSSNISVVSAHKRSSDVLQTMEKVLSDSHNLEPCDSGDAFSLLDKTAYCEAISSLGVILPPEEAIGIPGQPKICQATSASLSLSWDPPPLKSTTGNSPQLIKCTVSGYTVFVSKALQQQQCQQIECGPEPRIRVGGLMKGTTYMVSVRAQSNGVHGRNSPAVALLTPNWPLEFTFSSNWDQQGIMWWLGTTPDPKHHPDTHTPKYVNPHDSGLVIASWSRAGNGAPYIALGRDEYGVCCNFTTPEHNTWWQVDLRPCGLSVCPSKYSIKHDMQHDGFLRSWELRGSNNGITWTTLTRHTNDQTLNSAFCVGSWDIPQASPTSSFSMFSVAMTCANSSGVWVLIIYGFEIYGLVTPSTL